MILLRVLITMLVQCHPTFVVETYHKLVKTTPKPRATKNSKGELVGPLLLFLVSSSVGVGDGADGVVVVSDMLAEVRCRQCRRVGGQ